LEEKMRRFLTSAIVAALVLSTLTGCAAKSGTVSGSKPSVTASSASTASLEGAANKTSTAPVPVGPAVAASSGKTYTPSKDERKPMMDAARRRLGTDSQFVVLQLVSDGAWAVGYLQTVKGGGNSWLAWRNEAGGGWQAIWSATDSSYAATLILATDARFSQGVLSQVNWGGATPSSAGPVTVGMSGYNRAFIVSWSPKGDVSANAPTTVRISFQSDDTGAKSTVTFIADEQTAFAISQERGPDINAGYGTVSRNAFFKNVAAGAIPNIASNVKWQWRTDAQGAKSRYLTRLRASFASAG
jgi:hypothetical protein